MYGYWKWLYPSASCLWECKHDGRELILEFSNHQRNFLDSLYWLYLMMNYRKKQIDFSVAFLYIIRNGCAVES